MNVAQHAGNILDAWQIQDRTEFGTALELASASDAKHSYSRLESERGEVLQSVVEHLRGLLGGDELPRPVEACGAASLLLHLSSGARSNLQII